LNVVERRLLSSDPFMLFDVGCALGIDPVWRFFGDDLHAHAFDPQEEECAKLEAKESNPNVRYHASFVGLPPYDGFHQVAVHSSYFQPGSQLDRSSSFAANRRMQARMAPVATPASSLESTEQWSKRALSTRKVSIAEFAAERGINSIDFVKIDTDGHDLEAAASSRDAIQRTDILGFMVECFFAGSGEANENSFRNVDAFMQRQGFALYALTANRYSRAALPAPFLYPALYQTVSGQPVWGDMVYLRDGASKDYRSVWAEDLPVTKLLKLACLYELFQLPDCAAELLLVHGDRLKPVIDPAVLLNLLTPRFHDVERSYDEYLQLFEENPEAFFPQPRSRSA
jgi:FkbM family methyltransferase